MRTIRGSPHRRRARRVFQGSRERPIRPGAWTRGAELRGQAREVAGVDEAVLVEVAADRIVEITGSASQARGEGRHVPGVDETWRRGKRIPTVRLERHRAELKPAG